jgi:pre-mRNA-processing factor 39
MSTHGGPTEIPLLDSVISNAITPGSDVSTALSPEDREDISLLFLEVREFPIVFAIIFLAHMFPLVDCTTVGVSVPVRVY